MNILITSAGKEPEKTSEILKKAKDSGAKVYTCDMNPAQVAVECDGCFKVPICTSEDYVETIMTLCMEYNIGTVVTMTEREYVILAANEEVVSGSK